MDQLLSIQPLQTLHVGLRVVLRNLPPRRVALHPQSATQGAVGAVDPAEAQGLLGTSHAAGNVALKG